MREKEERIFFLALGLILLSLFFFYSLFQGEVFYLRDIFQNHYPIEKAAAEMIRKGNLPLWDPYQAFGEPLLADPNYSLLYPPMILFYLLPAPHTLTLLIILHFFAGGLFLFLLAKEIGLKSEGAFFAASVYTFSGFILSLGNIINTLFTITWAPLALFLFIRLIEGRKRRELILLSLVLALATLGGEYVALLLIFILLGFYALFPIKEERTPLAKRGGNIAYLLAGGVISFLLSSILLLPALKLFRHSMRWGRLPNSELFRFSFNPKRLIELLVPNFFGSPTNRYFTEFWGRVFFDRGYPLILGIYIGAFPLALAIIAILRGRRKALFFTGLGALGFLLSLGRYIPYAEKIYPHLPLLKSLRYPGKSFYLTILSLALLSGIGLEVLLFRKRETEKRILNLCLLILAIVIFGLGTIYIIGKIKPGLIETLISRIYIPRGSAPFFSKLAFKIVMRGLSRAIIIASAGFGIIYLSEKKKFPSLLTFGLATGLVIVDLFSANCGINPTIAPEFFTYKPRAVTLIERENNKKPFRIFRDKRPPHIGLALPSPSLEWGFVWERDVLRPATGVTHHLAYAFDTKIDKSNLSRYIDLLNFFDSLPESDRVKLLSLTNVRYLLTFKHLNSPSLKLLSEYYPRANISLKIYINNSVLPRCYLVEKLIKARSKEEELSLLLSPEVAKGEAAVVPAEEKMDLLREEKGGKAILVSYQPGRIIIKTNAPGKRLLVVNETYYPGWEVLVDGKESKLIRVNYLFQGVLLPPGKHKVFLRYRPLDFLYGAIISFIALGIVITLLVKGRERKKIGVVDRFRQLISDKFRHF